MSKHFELVKKNYDNGFWNIDRVRKAVEKKWINAQEFKEITGQSYF